MPSSRHSRAVRFVALEVVHRAADAPALLLPQHLQRLPVQVRLAGDLPRVKDDRQAELNREPHLRPKRLVLQREVRRPPVEVQARLADGDDLGRGLRRLPELLGAGVVDGGRHVHGVDAHAGQQHRRPARQVDARLRRRQRRAGQHNRPDTGGAGALQHAVQLLRWEVVKVGVCIHEHGLSPPRNLGV